jgi:hypothetical protein
MSIESNSSTPESSPPNPDTWTKITEVNEAELHSHIMNKEDGLSPNRSCKPLLHSTEEDSSFSFSPTHHHSF